MEKPIEGQINWCGDHMPTPLNYARYVDRVERVAESIELDDALFVPVVRCRDCVHFERTAENGICHRSEFLPMWADLNGYCAWGERKEGGDD